jgi:ketosteroid isomerase-like protein
MHAIFTTLIRLWAIHSREHELAKRIDSFQKLGMPYNNTYCWVCRFGDGKLRELTEYSDTELITAALKK